MFEYIFIALIYVPESSTLAISQRVSSEKECMLIEKSLKQKEALVDTSCIEVKALNRRVSDE